MSSKVSTSTSPDPATRYAKEVVAGKIVAGPHVRDACARHLRDLAHQGTADFPYRWSRPQLERVLGFFRDILRLNGGQFEGKPFKLDPSQAFILGSLFAWIRPDGRRRFRTAYIEQGKGNGKSPLVAGIGLYMMVADHEPRAEIYAAATKKDQAQILFRDAVAMYHQSPELKRLLRPSGGAGKEWNLFDKRSMSFFRTIASDDAQSGPRPHCALLDEIHEHKNGAMVHMMRAGFKFRRQPLLVMITNSGMDPRSVCAEQHAYGAAVSSGAADDEEYFAYICAMDPDDDPLHDEGCWAKANPLLDVAVTREFLRGQVREALGMPSKEATVRRLHFCEWVEARNPLLSTAVWLACGEAYDEELLVGRRCYGGLDLSSTIALTAFVLLFEPTELDPYWRQRSWFWLPEGNLRELAQQHRVPYDVWRAAGWLECPPGKAVDKQFVLRRLVECHERYDLVNIAYDRWRFADLQSLLDQEGVTLPLEPFSQNFQAMSPALEEYERLLLADLLRHDDNPVMTWNATCAVAEMDAAGNRRPTKRRSSGSIDGLVSAIMAAGLIARRPTEHEPQIFVLG